MASIESLTRADGSPSYKVRWYANGRRGVRTFRDHKEAVAYRALLERNELNQERTERLYNEAKDTGPTLAEVMVAHVDQLIGVGPYMLTRYRKSIPTHFAGIGQIRVANLTQADIKQWVQSMERKELSAKTIANHHGFLSAALNTAVNNQVITHNPTKGVRLPKAVAHRERVQFITSAEFERIFEQLPPHYKPFFGFLLATGLRFGEATALKPEDIHLDGATPVVRVVKAWKADGAGRFYVGPPKTRRGRRGVSLSPGTLELIRPNLNNPDLLFTNMLGNRIDNSAAHKVWGTACAKAGFTKENKPGIHALRHSHASLMIAAGMDLFAVSRRLGHENISTTSDIYADLLPDAHFNGANIAARALGELA